MGFVLRIKTWLLSVVVSLQAGGADLDRPVLYAVYGSDLIVRLKKIYRHPGRDGPDGVLVVALHGRNPAYIECRFIDRGAQLRCEAFDVDYPPQRDIGSRQVS